MHNLTPEQQAFIDLARDFARDEIAPYASDWDKNHTFPTQTLQKAAQLGFAGLFVPEKWGGSALSRLDAALILEELALACPSTAAYLSIHNMVNGLIARYADNTLCERFLPKLCKMEHFASYCLTEPGAGSDAAALQTTAVRDNDTYVLNGTKAFISGGSVSDIYVCMARTGESGPKGISCFLIEKNTEGLSFGKNEAKLGWHSQPTTMVFLENVRLPTTQRIGDEGQGFSIALSALNGGRVNIGACSLGGAKACLQHVRRYLQERHQFNQPLSHFQALQFKFADMLTQFEISRLTVHRAANSLDDQHPEAMMHCAMAKQVASDFGFSICNQAMQLYGGYGYLEEYPIERYFRDLRVHQILEGTNEIMRLIISRRAFAEDFEI